MESGFFIKMHRILWGLLLVSANAAAEPLEDVSLAFQDSGVVATIRLSGPVRYLSHFPASHGEQLEIFIEPTKGSASDQKWADNEVLKSPPSRLIPRFTVVTRDQQTDKPKLVVNFSREAEYSVALGKDRQSILITIIPLKYQAATGRLPYLPTVKPLAVPEGKLTEVQARMAETNKQAFDLMTRGSNSLKAKNYDAAIDAFNKLLLLPPNDYTQDGQEWVGVARERAGELDKAKIEYDLYLRLYPEGEGTGRVAQRLNKLSRRGVDDNPDNFIVEDKRKKKKRNARWVSFGSVSSRYYFGNSQIDSTFVFNNATTTSSLTQTDQSMFISTANASERYLSEDFDGRLVLSDVSMLNLLSDQASQNRLNALYGEIKGRTGDYLLRVGRQSPMGGGVQSRFDGVAGGYGDSRSFRVNAVAGRQVDYSSGSKPNFAGVSVDSGPVSVYAINQSVDGTVDRRALGAEFRQYKEKQTIYALLDYDTYFKVVNTLQVMGSTSMPGYNLNYMVDHRRPVTGRNALNGSAYSSVADLGLSADGLRKQALSRTTTTNMGQIGATMPLRKNWQGSANLRLSNTTGLEPLPGRGLEKGIYAQVIGSNLYKAGDTWSASVGLSFGQARGSSLNLYNHTGFNNGLMLDTSLQFSNSKDQFGGETKRTSPLVRGAYRLRDSLYLDADVGLEFINYSGPASSTKTTRQSVSFGFRWDF